jgi:hypothetical protein
MWIRGDFEVTVAGQDGDVRELLAEAAKGLVAERFDDVRLERHTITARRRFTDWINTPAGDWHPLAAFDEVRLTVSGNEIDATVEYELSSRHLLWFTVAFAFVGICFVEVTSIGHEGPLAAIPIAASFVAFAFVMLFGVNFLIAWLRGPRWLRAELRKAAANVR